MYVYTYISLAQLKQGTWKSRVFLLSMLASCLCRHEPCPSFQGRRKSTNPGRTSSRNLPLCISPLSSRYHNPWPRRMLPGSFYCRFRCRIPLVEAYFSSLWLLIPRSHIVHACRQHGAQGDLLFTSSAHKSSHFLRCSMRESSHHIRIY